MKDEFLDMNLHGQIMNIQVNKKAQNRSIDEAMKTHRTYHDILVAVYQRGHRDARHAAAELATAADQKIEELQEKQCGCCDPSDIVIPIFTETGITTSEQIQRVTTGTMS